MHTLALVYAALFVLASVGIALLVVRARYLVVLTQRTNVETLVLLFFLVFFLYVALLSAGAVPGTLRLAYYAVCARLSADDTAVERRKARALLRRRRSGRDATIAALNVAVDREGAPGRPIELRIADDVGGMGTVVCDGSRLEHRLEHGSASNNVLAFVAHQINDLLRRRGALVPVEIVDWKRIDDESTEQYLALVAFARNLERRLDAPGLWPRVELTPADLDELERRLSQICPALRSEAFLPDWEYAGQHKLPIIPEPLGIISLSRYERRVDPLTSMTSAALVVAGTVALLAYFILRPPWVPGA